MRGGAARDEEEHSPESVDALRNVRIVAAAAGCDFSLALAEYVTVSSRGRNESRQLGLGHVSEVEALPQKVEALSGFTVCAVDAGDDYSCAVTAGGQLYTWCNGRDNGHSRVDRAMHATHASRGAPVSRVPPPVPPQVGRVGRLHVQ